MIVALAVATLHIFACRFSSHDLPCPFPNGGLNGVHATKTRVQRGSLGKRSDKFEAVDPGICARACAATEECAAWSYGQQYGTKKCFLRKSDEGDVFFF